MLWVDTLPNGLNYFDLRNNNELYIRSCDDVAVTELQYILTIFAADGGNSLQRRTIFCANQTN